jgi:hypothetical protein
MVANPPAAPTRVAVVAVHGVGHHQTGASSDAIANLLSGLGGYTNPPGTAAYESFVCHPPDLIPAPWSELLSLSAHSAADHAPRILVLV